jgi:hypothetical protein
MFYRIVNHKKGNKITYDFYREENMLLCESDELTFTTFFVKEVRDTDIVDCILIDGTKSDFTTAMLKRQAYGIANGEDHEVIIGALKEITPTIYWVSPDYEVRI